MDKDTYFMNIAIATAGRSKCQRAKYGTVIVSKDGRIISTGYNGKPRGASNDEMCYRIGLPDNSLGPICCIHSEMNAMLFATPEELQEATIYVTGIPCQDCTLIAAQMFIARIVYIKNAEGHRGNLTGEFVEEYGLRIKFEVING
ncbi:hypothetical protein LCGC14_0466290 [marine sediment metagenome]|uniref:CMP/dCMP-type deaminase domain-containing protein n=1 Tax=marine sediment metagenome TaxID=412755 RepID=A0A0F9SIR1_9ZZZZ